MGLNVFAQMIIFFLLFVFQVQSTLMLLKQVKIHTATITGIDLFADLSKVVTASADSTFAVLNASTLQVLSVKNVSSPINGVGTNPANKDIIVLLNNGSVQIYDPVNYVKKSSYSYPNSGHGNCIQFFSNGSKYALGGLDTGQQPKIHFFDSSSHNLINSIPTTFATGIQIKKMLNTAGALIFLASNQVNAPIGIQMYALLNGDYVLAKKYISSNGLVNDLSLDMTGKHFYSVALDKTVRKYSVSPFDSMYEISSVSYLDENPLAIDVSIQGFTYISTQSQIMEQISAGQVILESQTATTSAVNDMINAFPNFFCTTVDGKLLLYEIQIFDGTDKNLAKWIVLSSVMGGIVFILIIAFVIEVKVAKNSESFQLVESQKLESYNPNKNDKQIP